MWVWVGVFADGYGCHALLLLPRFSVQLGILNGLAHRLFKSGRNWNQKPETITPITSAIVRDPSMFFEAQFAQLFLHSALSTEVAIFYRDLLRASDGACSTGRRCSNMFLSHFSFLVVFHGTGRDHTQVPCFCGFDRRR